MKKTFKALALSMAIVLLSTGLVGCSKNDNSKLIVATNAEFPPFEFQTDKGLVGTYDGIDIAMAVEIAKTMEKEVEISNMKFDSIIPAVTSGKADMGIAGMSVKPERMDEVDFSETYWVAVQTILVTDSNTDVTNVDTLAGKKVAVVTGYTADVSLSEIEKDKGFELKRYTTGVDAVQDLMNGKVDAAVIDSPTAKFFMEKNEGIKGVTDDAFFETEEYAAIVKKGNKELLGKINTAIKAMKDSGRVEEIAAEVDARMAK